MALVDYKDIGTDVEVRRIATPVADDPDWVGLQDIEAAIAAGVLSIPRTDNVSKVAMTVTWLDALFQPVAGRGSFDVEPIKIILAKKRLIDGDVCAGSVGYRRYILDDVTSADGLGVRFTNVTPPGAAIYMSVLLEPLRR